MDYKTNFKVNAAEVGDEPLGEFLHVASLLMPLYAPRACELTLFGKEGTSLATSSSIADCFEVAYYCVRNSMVHPRFRNMPPFHTYIWLGEDANGEGAALTPCAAIFRDRDLLILMLVDKP